MIKKSFVQLVVLTLLCPLVAAEEVTLDGHKLTPAQVVQIANGAKVTFSDDALRRVLLSFNVLVCAASERQQIYGLTTGVGANKDTAAAAYEPGDSPCYRLHEDDLMREVQAILGEHMVEQSIAFNQSLMRAQSAGVDEIKPRVVRAMMATRLNSVLFGSTGVQPHVAELYRDFLNHNIIPVVPARGSTGEADITLAPHIGLAMMGEWDVRYRGKKQPASAALRRAKLKPLVPFGKDALGIFSSNSYSEALAAIALVELRHLLEMAKAVFALSLEALNGNVEPFLEGPNKIRPFPYVNAVAADIRNTLQGSYLWDDFELLPCDDLSPNFLDSILKDAEGHSEELHRRIGSHYIALASCARALQDPLSFRTAAYTIGTLEGAVDAAEALLLIQLNSSDDNPGIVLDGETPSALYSEASHYLKDPEVRGAVVPTANFSPLPWVVEFQKVALAMAHASNAGAERTVRLSDREFTKLSRFLGTDKTVHAYGAVQKVFVAMAAENRALANPVSLDTRPVAAMIEDMGTNAPFVMHRVRRMIENHYYVLSLELMHAAQAIDLRFPSPEERAQKMSPKTYFLYTRFRERVPFMEVDRVLTPDINNGYAFLRGTSPETADSPLALQKD